MRTSALTNVVTNLVIFYNEKNDGVALVIKLAGRVCCLSFHLLREGVRPRSRLRLPGVEQSYLVDPASSHMLVSKIKPCMSKYKHLYTVKLRTAHYISNNLFDGTLLHG